MIVSGHYSCSHPCTNSGKACSFTLHHFTLHHVLKTRTQYFLPWSLTVLKKLLIVAALPTKLFKPRLWLMLLIWLPQAPTRAPTSAPTPVRLVLLLYTMCRKTVPNTFSWSFIVLKKLLIFAYTAILIIIEGQFQVSQTVFQYSKQLKAVSWPSIVMRMSLPVTHAVMIASGPYTSSHQRTNSSKACSFTLHHVSKNSSQYFLLVLNCAQKATDLCIHCHSHNNWGSVSGFSNGFPVVNWY